MPTQVTLGFFGGAASIPYLTKLLAQSVQQHEALKLILEKTKSHQELVKSLNKGIDDAYGMISTLPIQDERLLQELKNIKKATKKVEDIYGAIPSGPDKTMQLLHDNTIAESFKMSGAVNDYAKKQEGNSKIITNLSKDASPNGARKMNVRVNAEMLHTLNQILKINAQILKMQSENFALINKDSKESSAHNNKANHDLFSSFRNFQGDFNVPSFQGK